LSETKSITNSFRSDDFPWDMHLPASTSPEAQIREILASSPALPYNMPGRAKLLAAATALEPIPGSRPVSPAKVLDLYVDGSGGSRSSTATPRPGERPDTPMSQATILARPPSSHSTASTVVPAGSGSSARRLSRPDTPSFPAAESHIHPLFRSDSPTPPPVASPGTVVHASPLSGQVLTQVPGPPVMPVRSRSSSPRPSLHGRRVPSRAGSRLGTTVAAAADLDGEGVGVLPAAGRSTPTVVPRSPPVQDGPIPAFVLEAKRERII
jgi:hypothetical protein